MTATLSPETGVSWMAHVVRTMDEELAQEREWASRTASRVRNFVPEKAHVPKHRADVSVVADEAAVHDHLGTRHERRAV